MGLTYFLYKWIKEQKFPQLRSKVSTLVTPSYFIPLPVRPLSWNFIFEEGVVTIQLRLH